MTPFIDPSTIDGLGRKLSPIAAQIHQATVGQGSIPPPSSEVAPVATAPTAPVNYTPVPGMRSEIPAPTTPQGNQPPAPVQALNNPALTPNQQQRFSLPPPDRAQYRDSRLQNILGIIGAGLTGASNPAAGQEAARHVGSVRYDRAMKDYQSKIAPLDAREAVEKSNREEGIKQKSAEGTLEYHIAQAETNRQRAEAEAEKARASTERERIANENLGRLQEQTKAHIKELGEKTASEKAHNEMVQRYRSSTPGSPERKLAEEELMGVSGKLTSDQQVQLAGEKRQRGIDIDAANAPKLAIIAAAKGQGADAGKPSVSENTLTKLSDLASSDPGSYEAAVNHLTPKEREQVYGALGIPSHLDTKQQDQLVSSKITLKHADTLERMASDPYIASNIGPIMGRVMDTKGTLGGKPSSTNPEEERKEGEFLSFITQTMAWEAKNLTGGSRPAWQLIQLLRKTGPKAADTPARLKGAIDAMRASAHNTIDTITPPKKDGKTTPHGTQYHME